MTVVTDIENDLVHVLSWTLAHLESLAKEVVEEGEEVWPTLEQLITSGQLGKDILSILATLKPVISFVEANFPQYASMISWITTILTDIANFTVVNTPCTCPGCTTN